MTTSQSELFSRFGRAWRAAGANPADTAAVRERLKSAYSEPHRHYHSIHHIEHCLEEFDRVGGRASAPDELEIAIWFHDAVYDPKRTDNEEQSAAFARDVLTHAGAPDETIANIVALILSTKAHAARLEGDAALLSDVDLAILGAPPERFRAYEAAVRREYDFVPEDLFWSFRHRFARKLLARDRIFHTPDPYRRYEARARSNLQESTEFEKRP